MNIHIKPQDQSRIFLSPLCYTGYKILHLIMMDYILIPGLVEFLSVLAA